jgi:hypothetical protein
LQVLSLIFTIQKLSITFNRFAAPYEIKNLQREMLRRAGFFVYLFVSLVVLPADT